MIDKYDTWEDTEAACRAIEKVVRHMHDQKPKSNTPEEKLWEAEMKEIRKWIVSVHYRRIAINERKLK